MTVTIEIPPNLREFISHEIAAGEAKTEEEFVRTALQAYCEMRDRHTSLRSNVQRSLNEAEGGQTAQLNMDAIIARGSQRLTDGVTD